MEWSVNGWWPMFIIPSMMVGLVILNYWLRYKHRNDKHDDDK